MSTATRFVLMHTSHPGNIGAAARAIKVMGFADLVLVQPRHADACSQADAVAWASGAADILVRARIVDSLAEAVADCSHVLATAMTPRDFGPPTVTPRQALPALLQTAPPERVAFVFGSERLGMRNEDVWRCHACLSIPTAAAYGSLNLAQAVQVMAYEWRQALGGFDVHDARPPAPLARQQALDGLMAHGRRALEAIGALDPTHPRRLLPRLRQLLLRAHPTEAEVAVLRGLAHAALKTARRADAAVVPGRPPQALPAAACHPNPPDNE